MCKALFLLCSSKIDEAKSERSEEEEVVVVAAASDVVVAASDVVDGVEVVDGVADGIVVPAAEVV